jgi:ABC-type branched-subunit amino acid transport system permease subunit
MKGFLRRVGLCLVAYAALAWVPLITSEYHTHILVISLYYVILAVGWNLLAGYTGQFSLAHHTFAGIGAYTSALLVQRPASWPGRSWPPSSATGSAASASACARSIWP